MHGHGSAASQSRAHPEQWVGGVLYLEPLLLNLILEVPHRTGELRRLLRLGGVCGQGRARRVVTVHNI